MVKSVSAVALTDFRGALYFVRLQEGCGGATAPRPAPRWSRNTLTQASLSRSIRPYLVGDGGNVYFTADDAAERGGELWRSDGTEAGTRMVKDFGPGSSLYLQPTSTEHPLLHRVPRTRSHPE